MRENLIVTKAEAKVKKQLGEARALMSDELFKSLVQAEVLRIIGGTAITLEGMTNVDKAATNKELVQMAIAAFKYKPGQEAGTD